MLVARQLFYEINNYADRLGFPYNATNNVQCQTHFDYNNTQLGYNRPWPFVDL